MFGKKKVSSYDPAAQKPVLRCSIPADCPIEKIY